MKSLLAIYKDLFQKCENEKSSPCVETKMLCQAAEDYIEKLQSHDRWEYIIKMDIEDLKVSSQMQRNLLKNSDKLDRNAVGIGERYIMGIDIFLVMVSHEMERYGLIIDGIENPPVPETIQPAIVPDDEAGDNISLSTEEINTNNIENDMDSLPPDLKEIFPNVSEYNEFINDCNILKKPKQIVARLMDIHLSLEKPNTKIIYNHLKKKGIITIEYSYFCRLIRNENRA